MTTDGRRRGEMLRDDIYAAYERAQQTRRPRRLRPSAIGHQCARSLWMGIRWAEDLEVFTGQKLRLFETGHSQEDRLVHDLRRVGAEAMTRDPDDPKQQIGFEMFDGHMAGFIDAAATSVPHSKDEWVIGECKSHNAKSFKKLEGDGVEVSKPEHYAQMQLYLHNLKLDEALYIAVCKDTDHLFCEFIPRNPVYIERLLDKGYMAIFSPRAPAKIHKSGDFFVCKVTCRSVNVCQNGKLPERTCRTCMDCMPEQAPQTPPDDWPHDEENNPIDWQPAKGVWACSFHDTTLTLEQQQSGCEQHRYHPDMVSGVNTEAVAGADGREGFTYQMQDGSVWVDRGPLSAPIATPALTSA